MKKGHFEPENDEMHSANEHKTSLPNQPYVNEPILSHIKGQS